jgi:hypothetical protein
MNATVEARVAPGTDDATRRTIPFDYTLHFDIDERHEPRQTLQGRLQISVEAPFVALGVGYGFIAHTQAKTFGPPPPPPPTQPPVPVPEGRAVFAAADRDVLESALDRLDADLRATPLGGLTLAAVLRNGFRINPRYAAQLLPKPGGKLGFNFGALGGPPPQDLFEVLPPAPAALQFLYALHDQGSGRAFQSDPVLSTAGLGTSDGRRPFRQFAAPVRLAPRTTIRVDITLLERLAGELHFSLHGYKVLGTRGSPTDLARLARRRARR